MEGLAAASAVFAVISLAGQVLQGCTYLRSILQTASEAPKEIRLLLDELSIIEDIVKKSPDTPRHKQALALCNERLSRTCSLVSRCADVEKSGRCRKWGRQLAIALNTENIKKHLSTLREAKGYLETAQNESVTAEILETSYRIRDVVDGIHLDTQETKNIKSQTDQKLDALHDTAKETQRMLHALADRFVLLDAKAKMWAQQNEQMMRGAVQKNIRDSFEQLLLPAFLSYLSSKQIHEHEQHIAPSDYLLDWAHFSSQQLETPPQEMIRDSVSWSLEPRIIELQDYSEMKTPASCWMQKDLPRQIERKSLNPTPMDQRFLLLQRTRRATKCAS